jgi:hypothetical protein
MQVHVFIWEHCHGTDCSVHTTMGAAEQAAAEVARRWWDEARARDRELPKSAPQDDREAIDLYFAAQEEFEHYQLRTTNLDPGAKVLFFSSCALEAEKIKYTPFVSDDGRVGYEVDNPDGEPEFFYLLGSQEADEGDARTVFVYHGEHNDPTLDGPLHFYPVAAASSDARLP